MVDADDDLLAPTLSAPPTTSPLRVGVTLPIAIVVGAALVGCGEAPPIMPPHDAGPDTSDCCPGETVGLRDANMSQPDAGMDATASDAASVDASTDAV